MRLFAITAVPCCGRELAAPSARPCCRSGCRLAAVSADSSLVWRRRTGLSVNQDTGVRNFREPLGARLGVSGREFSASAQCDSPSTQMPFSQCVLGPHDTVLQGSGQA